MTPKDQIREVLYSKAVAGQQAQFALNELKEFLAGVKEQLFGDMQRAQIPDEAWAAAQKYKAYAEFVGQCESSILAGLEANDRIKGGIESGR